MYIYNVSVKIDKSIRTAWLQWMQEEHIPEVMATGLFTKSQLVELIEPIDEEGFTFSAQYHCDTLNQYDIYIEQHAPALREKGFAAFGNQFIAFRSVMQII